VVEQQEPWGPIVARRLEGAAMSPETPIDESLDSFA
jgi:hypothetical protein